MNVPHTPHGALPKCTHERGPGTTLCLHCRHEARLAARIKRQRLMLRGTAAAIVVATGLAASAFGASAMRGRNATRRVDSSAAPVAVATVAMSSPAATPQTVISPAASPAVVDSGAKSAAFKAPLEPILPIGESSLPDGVTASRADAIVTVSFDAPMTRTRRPEKFEQFVRSTLPRIYGAGVDSALAALPIGAVARQGDLLTELPARGIHIPIGSDWEVRVLPVIRPGVEGPLVVKYRTMVCGTGQAECGAR